MNNNSGIVKGAMHPFRLDAKAKRKRHMAYARLQRPGTLPPTTTRTADLSQHADGIYLLRIYDRHRQLIRIEKVQKRSE